MDPNNPNPQQQPPPGGYPPPQQPPPPAYPPQQPPAYPPQMPPSGAYPPQQPQPSGAYPPPAGYPSQMPPSGAYPPPPSGAYPPPQYPPSNAYPPGAYPPPYTGQPPYPGQTPQTQIDFQKAIASFTTPDWLIVGGAIVAFIAAFLPWYGVSYSYSGPSIPGFNPANYSSYSINAWHEWPGVFVGILSLAILAWVGIRIANVKVGTMPLTDKMLYLVAGVLVAVLSLLYIAVVGSLGSSGTFAGLTVSVGPSFGLFLGVLAGIAIAVGGYLKPNTPVA